MSKGIELSPKHGVNATIPVCIFCGEDKNEIALLGRVRERNPETGRAVRGSDVEMPMRAIIDLEPCDECKERLKEGIGILEADSNNSPTGNSVIVKEESFKRIFLEEFGIDKDLYNQVVKKRVMFLESAMFAHTFSGIAEEG